MAQHQLLSGHTLHRAARMRLEHVTPIKAVVAQQTVGPGRFGPTAASQPSALLRLVLELLRHLDQPPVQMPVTQFCRRPLLLCPIHGGPDRGVNESANIGDDDKSVEQGLP